MSDLVAFMRQSGLRIPAELLPDLNVTFGLNTGESLDGFAAVTLIKLGTLLAHERVSAGVLGDAGGVSLAVDAARAIRAVNAAAKLVLVIDPANAGFVPPDGLFDRVAVRPCDLAAAARELTGEIPDGVP